MHLADWLIMIIPIVVCAGIAIYARRYARSVADFMAGGRNAGRYLVCAAKSEQGAGPAAKVAGFQLFLAAGFTITWFNQITVPAGLLIMIFGFVIYRYRQTRAMTVGQFFEMRYSRQFRLFAGLLGFFAGLVNFGIIPVIGARFMVYFIGLPLALPVDLGFAAFEIPTYLVLMAIFLSICVITTTSGGQVSVLLTDCAEGMISQIFYTLIAIIVVFSVFKWADTSAVLLAREPGKSLVNPFDTAKAEDFNIWFVLMNLFIGIYRTMSWQNHHAFNSSAATPHESRMGGILGKWRAFATTVMMTLLAVCALTYLKSPEGQVVMEQSLSQIADRSTRDQMSAPIALTNMLPVGVKGMLLSVLLMGIIAGDGIHLHSWGSIFIQDVVMPLRKKPLTPKQHITVLRLGIVGVAVWAFLFGALFPQTKYVLLWFTVTEGIFVAGAGIAIIGGLYWSRGTNAGAWTALIVGAVLSLTGIGYHEYYERILYPGGRCWFNLIQVAFSAAVMACICYAIVSRLTCRQPHDMDKLLHRGKYAVASDRDKIHAPVKRRRFNLYRILGIDEQFTRADRWVTLGIFWWSMTWFFVFVVGSVVYLIHPFSDMVWATYWLWTAIYLPLALGVGTTVWFTIGCTHDMLAFFKRLQSETVNPLDDGSVAHDGHVVDTTVPVAQPAPAHAVHTAPILGREALAPPPASDGRAAASDAAG